MTIKEAIYILMHRFHGADNNSETNALSGTSANITVPRDCWITVTGKADNGITLAPMITLWADSSMNEVIASNSGIAYQGTAIATSAYVKKGTTIRVTAYRCQLIQYDIFTGGGITLAISMLSASERGCWRHEYQAGITHTSPRMEIPKTEVADVRGYIQCSRKRNSRDWRAERFRSRGVHVHHDIPICSVRTGHERFQQQRSVFGLPRDALRQDVQNSEQRQTAILRSCSKSLTERGCAA